MLRLNISRLYNMSDLVKCYIKPGVVNILDHKSVEKYLDKSQQAAGLMRPGFMTDNMIDKIKHRECCVTPAVATSDLLQCRD